MQSFILQQILIIIEYGPLLLHHQYLHPQQAHPILKWGWTLGLKFCFLFFSIFLPAGVSCNKCFVRHQFRSTLKIQKFLYGLKYIYEKQLKYIYVFLLALGMWGKNGKGMECNF